MSRTPSSSGLGRVARTAARVRAAIGKRALFAADSLHERLHGPRKRFLFARHEGREAEIRRAMRFTGHEVRFDELRADTVREADVVVPLDTPDLGRLHELRRLLPEHPIPIPSPESVELMDDKLALLEHLRAAGFADFVTRPRQGDTFPYVLKTRHGFGSHGVWIVHDEQEEGPLAETIASPDSFAEEFLSGETEHVTHCMSRGERIVFALTLRSRYTRADAVKNRDRAVLHQIRPCPHLPLFERMLASTGFEGISCFNYKERDGRPVVFEINPRFGASLAPLVLRLLRCL